MAAHLTGPFQAGAVDSELPIDADARVTVDFSVREPLLLLALRAALADSRVLVRALARTSTGVHPLTALEFGPYTESGAFLPLYLPSGSVPFAVQLELDVRPLTGAGGPVPPAEVAGL